MVRNERRRVAEFAAGAALAGGCETGRMGCRAGALLTYSADTLLARQWGAGMVMVLAAQMSAF